MPSSVGSEDLRMGFQQPQVTLLSLTLEPIVIHPNGPRAARGAANDPDCIPRVTMVPASIATAVPVPPAVTAAAAPDAPIAVKPRVVYETEDEFVNEGNSNSVRGGKRMRM